MKDRRREFLKLSGLACLGVTCRAKGFASALDDSNQLDN
jgi:hypothetical protein